MNNTDPTTLGFLYIVATPIGNRDDISKRAVETLKSVDLIFAEDTRHSSKLLQYLGINKSLLSLHAHNEHERASLVLAELSSGKSVALISDAGTPLISDPGFPVVRLAREHGISVVPIPGPSALITALSAAGVPCDSFLFLGFLPARHSARLEKLQSLLRFPYTLVFYESTHRIIQALQDVQTAFGPQCTIVLAKELTKTFERIISDSVSAVLSWLESDTNHTKGEFVLIIPPQQVLIEDTSGHDVLSVLLEELPLKQAVSLASKITRVPKNTLYDQALLIQGRR